MLKTSNPKAAMKYDPFVSPSPHADRRGRRLSVDQVYLAPDGKYLRVFAVTTGGLVICHDVFTDKRITIGLHEFQRFTDYGWRDTLNSPTYDIQRDIVYAYKLQSGWQVLVALFKNAWGYLWKQ